MVFNAGKVASLLSVDIASDLMAEQRQKYSATALARDMEIPGQFGFEFADAFNLNFSNFQVRGWQHFDVVFEKAGLLDIHRACTGCLQRWLSCALTQAFEPFRGGLIIALVHARTHPDCGSHELVHAIAARPDLNCTVREDDPLGQVW